MDAVECPDAEGGQISSFFPQMVCQCKRKNKIFVAPTLQDVVAGASAIGPGLSGGKAAECPSDPDKVTTWSEYMATTYHNAGRSAELFALQSAGGACVGGNEPVESAEACAVAAEQMGYDFVDASSASVGTKFHAAALGCSAFEAGDGGPTVMAWVTGEGPQSTARPYITPAPLLISKSSYKYKHTPWSMRGGCSGGEMVESFDFEFAQHGRKVNHFPGATPFLPGCAVRCASDPSVGVPDLVELVGGGGAMVLETCRVDTNKKLRSVKKFQEAGYFEPFDEDSSRLECQQRQVMMVHDDKYAGRR